MRAIGRGEWSRARAFPGDDAPWLLYILSSAVAMWIHYALALLPFLTGAILLLGTWSAASVRWRMSANLIIATAAIGILWLPNLRFFLVNADPHRLPGNFPPFLPSEMIIDRLVTTYGQFHTFGTLVFVALICLAVIALASWFRRGQWHWFTFALIGGFGWPVALLLVSWLYQPLFMRRLLAWSIVPSRVLAGIGLNLLPVRWLRPVILMAVMALNLHAIHERRQNPGVEWDRLVHAIPEDAASGQGVLICNELVHGFNYYWRERGDIDIWRVRPGPSTPLEKAAPPGSHPTTWGTSRPDPRELSTLFAEYRHLWFVVFTNRPARAQCDVGAVQETLAKGGQLVESGRFGRWLHLFHYERR